MLDSTGQCPSSGRVELGCRETRVAAAGVCSKRKRSRCPCRSRSVRAVIRVHNVDATSRRVMHATTVIDLLTASSGPLGGAVTADAVYDTVAVLRNGGGVRGCATVVVPPARTGVTSLATFAAVARAGSRRSCCVKTLGRRQWSESNQGTIDQGRMENTFWARYKSIIGDGQSVARSPAATGE